MSASDVSPPRQKEDGSKGEIENQAGGQLNLPTAVPDPSHTELTQDEFAIEASRNQPTAAGGMESLCDAQLSKEKTTIQKFTTCEEESLSSQEVEEPPKDEDGTKRRGGRVVTDADVLTAECEDDLDYDELMESESYDRSAQHQVCGDRIEKEGRVGGRVGGWEGGRDGRTDIQTEEREKIVGGGRDKGGRDG